jgi:hypothetical protein
MVPGAALPPFTASIPESSEFYNNKKTSAMLVLVGVVSSLMNTPP